jgi:hypothetical protein
MLAAVLLALGSLPQVPAPLFPAPEGWRTERIPFPLGFAPELEYRGFEDLAFAPGMFAKGSDSYFSYALALELEGDVAIDARFLDDFLTTYYRGLCRAVGESRALELDLDAVAAEVEGGGDRFRARVHAFDPFTDGGALELALELCTHPGAGKTELLGIASPKERSAPIWQELTAVLEAWSAARPAPLFLNHLFWIVDGATYEALRTAPFLREFAALEERTTVRKDMRYTGLYLYGRHTYVEFLAADEQAGLVEGETGVAFGLERAGASEALALELRARGVPASVMPITRRQGEEDLPWFSMLALEMPAGPLRVFSMEYEARFLERWRADLPARKGSLARADVLARYAEAIGQSREQTLMGDVVAVHLALDQAQRERLVAALCAASYEPHPERDAPGEAQVLLGPCVGLTLTPSATPGGLTRCRIALAREARREPITFGRIRLRLEGATAEFEWAP